MIIWRLENGVNHLVEWCNPTSTPYQVECIELERLPFNLEFPIALS